MDDVDIALFDLPPGINDGGPPQPSRCILANSSYKLSREKNRDLTGFVAVGH
ncbi:hypothetical protein EGH21_11080 [Halomicroarcula sp. F13]|uniref:Uncharacterized protein n=1 Tax=Haloarcula rubra TaxID=2487747 RepID=A0AAW4PQV1_9EURY|nr:hypothetical protein [Halomicroarcula rubra]MBX0323571.1 hypothetical protein [Halomicroarcula rubra]